MGTTYSSYYDLVRLREMGPEARNWATTDSNFEIISLILKAFEQHVHTGAPGLQAPSRTVTITVASPTVINLTAHGLVAGQSIIFYTTGALPLGLTAGTIYFVSPNSLTTNTFKITTVQGSTVNDVNTSGTQSGIQSIAMQPALTEVATGGTLAPGTTVGVRLSYLNAQGLETNATIENDIALSPATDRPLSPILNTVTPTPNTLAGGQYMYVMTKVKGSGETTASDALPVSVPFDQTYAAVINFAAINTYTDGTTSYNIYRSAGLNSSFQLVGEITDVNATAFTDNNNSIDQSSQPPGTSTFDTTKSLVIDWSQLIPYPAGAAYLNIYITQQSGVWGNNSLLTSVNLSNSPPSSYTYLGSESLSPGYPYDQTQVPNQPSLIDPTQISGGSGGGGSGTAAGAPPIGAQMPYTGTGDPTVVAGAGQWVVTDGRLIDRNTYSGFFNTTGHTYNGGVDPGGSMVRIPDKRGKKSIGAINMGTTAGSNDNAHTQAARGQSGGEVSHTNTTSEIPGHSHVATDSGHTHGPGSGNNHINNDPSALQGTAFSTVSGTLNYNFGLSSNTGTGNALITVSNNTGGGGSHNNVDPYEADTYIVRIL